jgi:hypothetical protein
MAESRNRTGGVYSLTVIAPILPGREEDLRSHIESLPSGPDSPLARLDGLHYSRMQIFSELVYQGRPQKADRLKGSHFVFTSTFDGELGPYLAAIRERLGPEADAWWSHCAGYPGTDDAAAFERWVCEHQHDSALFVSAYPGAGVTDVLESLELRERIVEFAAEAQGLDAVALQERFRETFSGPERR